MSTRRRYKPGEARRISLELPADLIDRLEEQAEMIGCSRRFLIESACLGLMADFDAIDAECGRPCTCGVLMPDGSARSERRDHLPSCLWRPAS